MDYFLVSFQSVADLVFSGYLGLFFFFYDMFLALNANCKSFTEEIHLQQQVLGWFAIRIENQIWMFWISLYAIQ